MRFDNALCNSVGTPAMSPSACNASFDGNTMTCWRGWFCESTADSARPSSSHRCMSACTGVHSAMPGGGLPSRRDRVKRRSEEHTSELQSQFHLVCRLLLE